MAGLAILRNLLLKEAAIESGKRSGIAQIGDVTRDIAEKKFQAFVSSAKKQGVDLDKYTEQELKYIIELNKPKGPRVISADSPEGRGITEALLGIKEGKVIKADFGKPFAKEVESMQDIADARLIKDMYRTAGPRNLDEDAEYLAEFIAEDAGKIFDDLTAEQQRAFRNRARKALRKNVEKYKTEGLERVAKTLEANQKRKLNTFKNLDDKKKLNDDEYEEFLEEIGGEDRLEAYDFDGTAGSAKRILKEDVEYEQSMFDQYKKGKLDPEPKPASSLDREVKEAYDQAVREGRLQNIRLKDGRRIESEDDFREYIDELNEDNNFANGGRAGFDKGGMSRRKFMQIMGGLAALPVVGKLFKGAKVASKVPQVVTTPPVPGKPAWFDSLVNKVIREGDDVTKRFATKDREIVHVKALDDETTIYVHRDLDTGTVRVDVDDPVINTEVQAPFGFHCHQFMEVWPVFSPRFQLSKCFSAVSFPFEHH